MTGGAPVVLRAVGHTFSGPPEVTAVDRVDLDLGAGEFVAVVGPSGCGKSTLLRMLAGLVVPTRGDVVVGGRSVAGRPGHVAYGPQRDALLPWRRVLGNATLGAEVAGVRRSEARADAEALLGRFGLSGFTEAWPATLSGGMRQRLALLRTFLVPRPVLVLDEPLGSLDALTRAELRGWLEEVWLADGRTVVLVTHDVEEALLLADRVVVLTARPATVVTELAVPFARPRPADLVTAPELVARRGEVLAALGAGRAVQVAR